MKLTANDVANYGSYSTVRYDLENPEQFLHLPKKLEVIFILHYEIEVVYRFLHQKTEEKINQRYQINRALGAIDF